jgi:hypothetical protein
LAADGLRLGNTGLLRRLAGRRRERAGLLLGAGEALDVVVRKGVASGKAGLLVGVIEAPGF